MLSSTAVSTSPVTLIPDQSLNNMYSVKEIFYTLQGEGARAGRASVFLRFAGCNLWNGKEQDRAKSVCRFCDTDFVGTGGENGGKFNQAAELADKVNEVWKSGSNDDYHKYVVISGGEPLLQVDSELLSQLHERDFEIAVETNGTIKAPIGIDWICVSPKAGTKIIQNWGNELKLVYPQLENDPSMFELMKFDNFFLSPKDMMPETGWPFDNSSKTAAYCMANPQWRLSLQTHKILGLK